MFNKEKEGGTPNNKKLMEEFYGVINRCDLIDAGYRGDRYTCMKNKTKKEVTKERLDRFFINHSMKRKAKVCEVEHLNYHQSDHRPILMQIGWETRVSGKNPAKKIIKFEESWVGFEECKENIVNSWKLTPDTTSLNISKKI